MYYTGLVIAVACVLMGGRITGGFLFELSE